MSKTSVSSRGVYFMHDDAPAAVALWAHKCASSYWMNILPCWIDDAACLLWYVWTQRPSRPCLLSRLCCCGGCSWLGVIEVDMCPRGIPVCHQQPHALGSRLLRTHQLALTTTNHHTTQNGPQSVNQAGTPLPSRSRHHPPQPRCASLLLLLLTCACMSMNHCLLTRSVSGAPLTSACISVSMGPGA